MNKPAFQPWWPKGPKHAVEFMQLGMIVAGLLIVAGIYMLFVSPVFLLGIVTIVAGFLFLAGFYGLLYVLEMLIWQRELDESRQAAEISENSLERTNHD